MKKPTLKRGPGRLEVQFGRVRLLALKTAGTRRWHAERFCHVHPKPSPTVTAGLFAVWNVRPGTWGCAVQIETTSRADVYPHTAGPPVPDPPTPLRS